MPDAAGRPLRCAFVNHYVGWGGAEGMLLTLFEAVDRSRVAPVLVVPGEGRLPAGARALDVPVTVVPVDSSVLEVTRGGAGAFAAIRAVAGLIRSVARLTRALRGMDLDIVVTNSAKAHVYGSIAANLSRTPVVWRLNDTLDSPDFSRSLYKLLIALGKRVPRAILCVSDASAAPLLREGVPPSRVVTLYSGIDLDSFATVPPPTITGDGSLTVGSFGRLTPLKGHDVVMQAVQRLVADGHNASLVIAGGPAREAPDYGDELVLLANDLGIGDRVRIEAAFPDGGLPAIMARVDVVVQASVLPDSLPTTVIEAMAGGRAVVASAIGGCPELVTDGTTGRLFPPGDVKALAACLAELAADPPLVARLGLAARQDAFSRFAVDEFADVFCCSLESVARPRGTSE